MANPLLDYAPPKTQGNPLLSYAPPKENNPLLDYTPSVSSISKFVRGIMRNVPMEQLKTSQEIYVNREQIPKPLPTENIFDYSKRASQAIKLPKREQAIISRGTLPQFEDLMTVGVVGGLSSHPAKVAKILAKFTAIEEAVDLVGINKAIQSIPNATMKDIVDMAKFAAEGYGATINVKGVKAGLVNMFKRKSVASKDLFGKEGEGKVIKEQWQIENEEIKVSIDNIKNDINKLIGGDSTNLLERVGIKNESDVSRVLSWQKMKRFSETTEDNIKDVYNYFAEKSEKPFLEYINYGKDPYNPMKDMSGKVEGGGALDSKIYEKTQIALSKLHQSIKKELSKELGGGELGSTEVPLSPKATR